MKGTDRGGTAYRRAVTFFTLTALGNLLALAVQAHSNSQSSAAQSQPSPPTQSSQSAPPQLKPPKKVWTNDDLPAQQRFSGSSAETPRPQYRRDSSRESKGSVSRYRQQLAQLTARLEGTDRQLVLLQAAKNGEQVPAEGVPFYVRRGDIDTQIADLQKRHNDLVKQIGDIEDRARHEGIDPGELRAPSP